MLAQNFKTAEELGITDQLHTALITVLGMMERGEIKAHSFNMAEWCGTACCMYGWARRVDNTLPDDAEECELHKDEKDHGVYYQLFVPLGTATELRRITVEKGAQALRAYLTVGKADWS